MKTQLLRQCLEQIGPDGHKRRFDVMELTLQPTPISITCFQCGELYRSGKPGLIRIWQDHHKCNRTRPFNLHAAPNPEDIRAALRCAPCPICEDGTSRLFVQEGIPIQKSEDHGRDDDDFTSYIECVCGLQGPSAINSEAAIAAWNHNIALLALRITETKEAA